MENKVPKLSVSAFCILHQNIILAITRPSSILFKIADRAGLPSLPEHNSSQHLERGGGGSVVSSHSTPGCAVGPHSLPSSLPSGHLIVAIAGWLRKRSRSLVEAYGP